MRCRFCGGEVTTENVGTMFETQRCTSCGVNQAVEDILP